jgi:phosphoglycolate phosphatase
MRPSLVLFDVDGTLVDSQDVIVASMTDAFADHGLAAPPRPAVLSIVGLSLPVAIARLGEELAGSQREGFVRDKVVESYKQAFHRRRTAPGFHEPLFAGAADGVRRIARSFTIGLATGKSRRGVEAVVAHHGFEGLFATVMTADDAPSKPHPGMVLRAAAETGVDPASVVVIGDTVFDMEMARAAGARAIGVAWGYHPTDALEAAGAFAIARHFDELDALIDALAPVPQP